MVFGEVKVSEEAILIAASLAALYLNAAEGGEFEQLYELVLDVSRSQPVTDGDSVQSDWPEALLASSYPAEVWAS
jgi:hypothetical protein